MRMKVWGAVFSVGVFLVLGCSSPPAVDRTAAASADEHGFSDQDVKALADHVFPIEAAGSPSVGPEDAPVTMVVFFDYLDPACLALAPSIDKVHDAYGDKVRIVVVQTPISHPNSYLLAQAAFEAAAQGKFWPVHQGLVAAASDLAYSDYRLLNGEEVRALHEVIKPSVLAIAGKAGCNVMDFKSSLDNQDLTRNLQREFRKARAVGVKVLPAVFINGRFIPGVAPYERYRSMIDEELGWATGGNRPEFAQATTILDVVKPPWDTPEIKEAMAKAQDVRLKRGDEARQAPKNVPSPDQRAEQIAASERQKVEVGSAPVMGPAKAPITVITYLDYQ